MTDGTTYQPNFVIKDEDEKLDTNVVDKDQNEATTNDNIKTEKTSVQTKFFDHEADFIIKQRTKLRLSDPKGLYFNRHVEISYYQSLWHFITLLISCSAICWFSWIIVSENKESIIGVGEIANLTLIDRVSIFVIGLIFFNAVRNLFKIESRSGIIRYRLAMLANAINYTAIAYIKLLILFLAVVALSFFSSDESNTDVLNKFNNGVFADIFDAIFSFINIIIVTQAFRYCKKGNG
jgi:hypothetical protein